MSDYITNNWLSQRSARWRREEKEKKEREKAEAKRALEEWKKREALKREPSGDWLGEEWERHLRLGQDRVERESAMLASITLARKEGYPDTFKKLFANVGYDYTRIKFGVSKEEMDKWMGRTVT